MQDREASPAARIEIPTVEGGHDGADPMMRRELFLGISEAPPELRLRSSALDGALAVAAGEAIWRSIEEGRIIEIAELLDPTPSED